MLTKCTYPVAWVGGPKDPGQTFSLRISARGRYTLGRLCCHPDWARLQGRLATEGIPQAALAFLVAETSLGTEYLGSTVGGMDHSGRGRWAGEDPEISLKIGMGAFSHLCSLRVGAWFRFLPCRCYSP